MITSNEPCPCGSDKEFGECCEVIISDHSKAETAEQLMRSRYVGFAIHHTDHVLRTWDEKKRPKGLNFEDNPVSWIGLEVHSTSAGAINDDGGEVEFTATYIENGMICKLREKSTFRKKEGLWYYVYGDTTLTKDKPARNAPCLCGSGKKFKKCCYKNQ